MKLLSQFTQRWRALQQESAVRAAYEEGRLEDAISHARALYEFDLGNPWANFFLACHHLEAERYGEALRHLERVRDDWPDDAHTHFAIGLCHDYLEDPRAAVTSYRLTLAVAPEWAKARKNLGRDLYLLGDYHGAKRLFGAAAPPCPTTAKRMTCSGTSATGKGSSPTRSATMKVPGAWIHSTSNSSAMHVCCI